MSIRAFVGAGVLVALLLAGVLSHFASSDPDGLNRVAEDNSFAQTESDHPAADGPLSGYQADGVEGPLSGGVAGVVGTLVVLVLAGGLTLVVRRRGDAGDPAAKRRAGP
ncbi:hypothetical protein BH18ACT9_BH18ACT9_19010 [soil metagenome]